MKRAGPEVQRIWFETSGFKRHRRGPLLFCLTERIGSSGQSKAEDLESVVCGRKPRARLNQKL